MLSSIESEALMFLIFSIAKTRREPQLDMPRSGIFVS